LRQRGQCQGRPEQCQQWQQQHEADDEAAEAHTAQPRKAERDDGDEDQCREGGDCQLGPVDEAAREECRDGAAAEKQTDVDQSPTGEALAGGRVPVAHDVISSSRPASWAVRAPAS
jgi:hypothetical protein